MDGRTTEELAMLVAHVVNEKIRCKEIRQGNKVILIGCDDSSSSESSYTCPLCDFHCENENILTDHISRIHNLRIYLKDGNVSNAEYLVELVNHLDEDKIENYKCVRCDKEYSAMIQLDLHNQLHEPYLCEQCSQSFSTIYSFSEHIMSEHDGNYRKSFTKCNVCKLLAISRKTLLQHMLVHLAIAKLPCKICSAITPHKDSLWEHIRTKHAELEPVETVKVRQCLTCDATFHEEQDLMRHLRQYRAEPLHKCKYCHMRFYEVKDVEDHLNEFHSVKASHAKMCKVCMRLISIYGFNKHMRKHLEIYFCDLCQGVFISVDSLIQHRLDGHPKAANDRFIDELRKKKTNMWKTFVFNLKAANSEIFRMKDGTTDRSQKTNTFFAFLIKLESIPSRWTRKYFSKESKVRDPCYRQLSSELIYLK